MSADLQALTGSSESAALALRAISQIKMKGRLQAEEITGQLAEHGVSADEVYKVLGKTLGKTREEILKMQKAGDLSADVAIPAILQAVRNQLGVEKSGGFAATINATSVGGMWRTLSSQVQNAFISLGERVGPGITRAFQSIMASIQSAIASPQMTALSGAVVQVFESLSSLVGNTDFATLLKEAAASLATELTAAATFIRDHGAELRENFMAFVRAMGVGLQAAVDFMKPMVDFMNSGFGKFMMTPLNETLGPGVVDTLKARERGDSPRSAGALFAGQAGAATTSRVVEAKFGDIIINAADGDGTTPGAIADAGNKQRQMLISYLEGGV
jgi:tape measure domain-containing protein